MIVLLMRFLGLVVLVRDGREFDYTEKLQHTSEVSGFNLVHEYGRGWRHVGFSSVPCSAWRRRQRRLRSWRASQWPCPQPPTTASTRWRQVKRTPACGHRRRTGPGRLRTELYGDRSPKQPGMQCSSSFLTKTPAGARPPPLVKVRPQEGVKRHTVEHIIDVPFVQILDVPVAQMGNQVVEFMQTLDTVTPEQVIEVPKLSQDRIPQRSAVRRPQKAEQLVELPTDPAYVVLVCASSVLDGNLQGFLPGQSSPASREDLDLLRRAVEQIIGVPVQGRGGGGGRGGLQGSSGQNSTAQVVEQIVDFSVSGGLQGSLPGQISSQRSLGQLVDIPAGGGPQLPDPGASSSSAVSRDKLGEGFFFFRIFPRKKKVRAGRRGAGERGQPTDASCL